MDRIETYFAAKGIKVIVNGLGFTPELQHSFVSDYRDIVDKSPRKKSQYVKVSTYSDMYTFEPRPKYTGFENYKVKDKKFRKDIANLINELQYSPSLQVDNRDLDTTKSYKTLLSNSLEQLENPLLYLSGGMDSELVANAFLEKNIKFKTVVFEYIDDNGNITNLHDVSYAYKYCKKHGIVPEIVQINIDKLWDSHEFKKLAIELQYTSPHISTYAHMVKLMSLKYPSSTHIFGGEVRFFTDYVADNGELANIILLQKIVPAYDGGQYINGGNCGQTTGAALWYYSNGLWRIFFNADMVDAGLWYSTGNPVFSYMIRVSAVSNVATEGNLYPTEPTGFQNITTGGVTPIFMSVQVANFGEGFAVGALFTTELREVGQTFPGMFASLELYCTSLCIS